MRGSRTVSLLAAGLLAVVLVAGCKQTPKATAPAAEPAAAAPAEAAAPAPAEAAAPAPAEAPAPAPEGEPAAAEAPAAEAAPAEPAMDREKLSACYQEVYCAQKKGEMDKILDIYKAHGFETPQDFTKAWIEAAKDTDWITRIANSVSKKCQ
ncbi:MAG TPA: hypothetical protein PK313_05265 [Myxococcota bacterium]|nr:hypothetical protein [Myxococcota bacterium]